MANLLLSPSLGASMMPWNVSLGISEISILCASISLFGKARNRYYIHTPLLDSSSLPLRVHTTLILILFPSRIFRMRAAPFSISSFLYAFLYALFLYASPRRRPQRFETVPSEPSSSFTRNCPFLFAPSTLLRYANCHFFSSLLFSSLLFSSLLFSSSYSLFSFIYLKDRYIHARSLAFWKCALVRYADSPYGAFVISYSLYAYYC